MENEAVHLVRKIVETYMKDGASAALKLTRNALNENHRFFHLLHRLHAMYIFENDRSKIDSALKSANEAVCLYPRSLEYRFFYVSLLYNKVDYTTDATDTMLVVWECEEALKIYRPLEPYWKLYMVDDKAAGIESGEEAVENFRFRLGNMINACYREIDALPENLFDDILSSDSSSFEKMRVTGNMLKSDYYSCAFVQRMHSEFCFEYAMEVEDIEERKKFLDQALCSAKMAFGFFETSMDYRINLYTRELQCRDDHSHRYLYSFKEKLTRSLDFAYNQEPYYKYLVRNDITDLGEQTEYYKNCIRLLLTFVGTLEIKHLQIINDNEEVVEIYYECLDENNLRNLAEQSEFFQKNIKYLLHNLPMNAMIGEKEVGKQKRLIELENKDRHLIEMIVNTYEKRGPSYALRLTRYALRKSESHLLLRLHAKYIYENDESEIESALKFAKRAVSVFPSSLEYRFFYASLLYNKAVAAEVKDNMLYGEIMSECNNALLLKWPLEPFWPYYMISKKTADIESLDEAVEYVKHCLRDLSNMCLSVIDDLPKKFLDDMLSSEYNSHYKLRATSNLMANNHKFCAFVHRLHSEICFDLAIKEVRDTVKRKRWLNIAFISARMAQQFFNGSLDYAINYFTRTLQQRFVFSRHEIQSMKKRLTGQFRCSSSLEPYYKYLVNNNLTDFDEQMEYYNKCGRLLLTFIKTMEEVLLDHNIENQDLDGAGLFMQNRFALDNYEIYYKKLDVYNLRSFAKRTEYFNKNIKYLLVNNLHKMNIVENNEVDVEDLADKYITEKSEDAKEDPSQDKRKKKKNKKKKNKKNAKGLEASSELNREDIGDVAKSEDAIQDLSQDLEDKDDVVHKPEDAIQDLSQDLEDKGDVDKSEYAIQDLYQDLKEKDDVANSEDGAIQNLSHEDLEDKDDVDKSEDDAILQDLSHEDLEDKDDVDKSEDDAILQDLSHEDREDKDDVDKSEDSAIQGLSHEDLEDKDDVDKSEDDTIQDLSHEDREDKDNVDKTEDSAIQDLSHEDLEDKADVDKSENDDAIQDLCQDSEDDVEKSEDEAIQDLCQDPEDKDDVDKSKYGAIQDLYQDQEDKDDVESEDDAIQDLTEDPEDKYDMDKFEDAIQDFFQDPEDKDDMDKFEDAIQDFF